MHERTTIWNFNRITFLNVVDSSLNIRAKRSIACADVRSDIPMAKASLDRINSSPPSILNGEFRSNHTGTSASLNLG